MACRIGITTNPDRRKQEWKRFHPNLHGWKTWGPYRTKAIAQAKETELSRIYGCVAEPGGADASGKWVVYKFDY